MSAPPPPPRGGLSLYDNLTDPNDPTPSATISSAPVRYDQGESQEAAAKKPINPSLRFQPIRRPQAKQPSKSKPSFPKAAAPKPPDTTRAAAENLPAKSTAADWAATEEDEWIYGLGEKKHQRGGRRKKKKKQQHVEVETDWNELYDPARPTNIDEYLRSDEKIDEVTEWKALLYRHREKSATSDLSDSEEDTRPTMSSKINACGLPILFTYANHLTDQFAPPPSLNAYGPPPQSPPSAPPQVDDDTDARQPALAQGQAMPPAQPEEDDRPSAPPPPQDSSTISAPPVRYTQPSPPLPPQPLSEAPSDSPSEPTGRSSRPGQAGFATRLMQKYGWKSGTGLGASNSGIVQPLRVQVEKRRKKADGDGGGWAEPGGKGKIIGGKSMDGKKDGGKFGTMSEVIVLGGMLQNMPDLQQEMEDGLGQEIGEECGEKYGRVERLYIDQDNRQVFIKFTDGVSALRVGPLSLLSSVLS